MSFDKLPGIKTKRRDTAEGLLAPHTPTLPRTPISQIPSSPMRTPSQFTAVPRSPDPRTVDSQELDVHFSPSANSIKLSAPPRRSSQGPMRRTTGDSIRIGQRRVVSPFNEDDIFKDQ
ncbi:hypothetical protein BDQ17DRAFT_1423403 [Cyathus striatus]|nr:hypothetical protein BDQ17DRAFT_1423403 [Cyathus striatus]